MIGFESPQYTNKIACFSIEDIPGSQYVYRNRDVAWINDFLISLPHGGCYLVTSCSGSPEHISDPTFSRLQEWWQKKKIFPRDGGAYLSFTHDRLTYFLLYGSDPRMERAWIANPLGLVFGGRIPYKCKRQRKQERSDPTLRNKNLTWKRSSALSAFIPGYIHGFSEYEPAPENQVGCGRGDC